MVKLLLRITHNDRIREGVLESLVYSPVKSFFTFGYGGAAPEMPEDI
jgi:hypothetical protein